MHRQARRWSEIVPAHGYELERCPFCGSGDIELIWQKAYFVSCEECYSRGEKVWVDVKGMDAEAKAAAVAAWNKRVVRDVEKEIIAAHMSNVRGFLKRLKRPVRL